MKKNSINLKRIAILPLILTLTFSFTVGFIAYNFSTSYMEQSQIEDGSNITELLSKQIETELKYHDSLLERIDENLIKAGKTVIANQNLINDQYLSYLLDIFEIHELFWYNSNGTIIYDANSQFTGWTARMGDPIYSFINSGLDIYVEDIRKSTESDQYFKFVYLRAENGFFVQAGVNADYVNSIIEAYSLQNIVTRLVENDDKLLYALVTNSNLVAIADSDVEDIGINYSDDEDYNYVLTGKTVASRWYYPKIGKNVLEISTPLYFEDEIIGLVAIGFSLDQLNHTKTLFRFLLFILILIIIIGYLFFQIHYVFNPIKQLEKTINNLKIKENKISYKSTDVFYGVYDALDNMIDKINIENSKNVQLTNELKELAYIDYLTKIPNRLSFIEKFKTNIIKDRQCAIFFIDLDGFKEYNDTKGHTFGDKLLVLIANELNKLSSDKVYVSRYGGDEFLIYYAFDNEKEIDEFAVCIKALFDEPFKVDKQYYPLDVSIGISLYPKNDLTIEQLIRKADISMYYSKKQGINRIVYFDESLEEAYNNDAYIINILKKAIKNDGFYLVYQPQININNNEVISMEALIRLKDENISPSFFIPIAEKGGIINQIGKIVLEKAIVQMAEWKILSSKIVPVYVNFSSYQLDDEEIVDYIILLLKTYNIEPHYLGIEVTESAMIEKDQKASLILKKLTELGIKTALDDFGSGQSGINYLTKFKVETVKIDKEFVDKYLNDKGLEIFNSVINLIELLGFKIIVEGIETKEQIDTLTKTSCHLVQGYYYYKPLPVEQINDMILKK